MSAADDRILYLHGTEGNGRATTVNEVLNRLTKPQAKPVNVSWREFLGACSVVSWKLQQTSGQAAYPFDFGCPAADTVNCLLLEMWMSEIRGALSKTVYSKDGVLREKVEHLSAKDYDPRESKLLLNLCDLLEPKGGSLRQDFEKFSKLSVKTPEDFATYLPLGALCLYKTWLLLLEALHLDDLFDIEDPFQIRSVRGASINAVATRHWYKTACEYSKELRGSDGRGDLPLPVRLPGWFGTRGDWFLSSMDSSRSQLLARHAMDLLSSRRANLT